MLWNSLKFQRKLLLRKLKKEGRHLPKRQDPNPSLVIVKNRIRLRIPVALLKVLQLVNLESEQLSAGQVTVEKLFEMDYHHLIHQVLLANRPLCPVKRLNPEPNYRNLVAKDRVLPKSQRIHRRVCRHYQQDPIQVWLPVRIIHLAKTP